MNSTANGATHLGRRNKFTGRMLRATAIGTVAVLVVAGPAKAITPTDAGDAGGTTIPINNSAGDQIDPHVDSDLAAYSDQTQGAGAVHFYDFTTGIDHTVPRGSFSVDSLADVSGSRIAMSRQTGLARRVVVYDTALDTTVEIDPPTEYGPFATAIAGTTVAFVDALAGNGDIQVADVNAPTAPLTNLSSSLDFDANPNVSPDGDVVVWEACNPTFIDCDVLRAMRAGGVWGPAEVVGGGSTSNELNPDVDGVTIVYDADRPSVTDQDVYLQPLDGGSETQLRLPGIQRNPAISAGVVSFEHKDGPGTPADLFVYETASNRVFRVTNTPTFDESLNDISVLPNGDVRLVWAVNDGLAGEHNIYARTLTLPALDTEPPAQPRDILVIDPDVPPVSTAVLFRVDPQSGARSVLSNFGSSNPNAVAIEANGNILVTDTAAGTDPSGGTNEWGAVHRISRDPVSGDLVRTILTDFGVGASTGRNPVAVAVEADGRILVVNGSGGTTGIPVANRAVLVRIDPVTGARTVLSDFGNTSQGGLGVEPRGVAVEASGSILVIDAQAGIGGAGSGQGELVRIDPQTGVRTSLTNFGSGPFQGSNPTSVAVEATGQILVTDEGHPSTTPLGLLYRIDPQTGARIILSDLNTAPNTGREPEGVALEADGQILVVDKHAGPLTRGLLFRIDPQTGARTVLSDFGVGTDQGNDPLAVAVVPDTAPPPRPTLIVIDEVVNDDGGTATAADFTVAVDGANPSPATFAGQGVPGTAVSLDAGAYSVSVGERAGYTTTLSPDCTGTIAPGEVMTCTITHDDQPAHLIVINNVINDNGGTAAPADFTMTVTGTRPSQATFPGAAKPGTNVTLEPGEYSVSFEGPADYGEHFSTDCTGTIASGETKICTITNDDQPAGLIVVNEVVNDDGGTATAADFAVTVDGVNASPVNFPGAASPGTTVTLDAGAYSVRVGERAGYTTTRSPDCTGTIAAGGTKTCTITNDDQPGTLIVINDVTNDNGGSAVSSDWAITVNGADPSPSAFSGAGSPGTIVSLNAGPYTVTAVRRAGYNQAVSTDCAGTIAPGEVMTCTILNDDQPGWLVVITNVINDNGGSAVSTDWAITVGGADPTPSVFPGTRSPGTTVSLNAGAYAVTANGPAGYSEVVSADCAGTIAIGETKTCTITNDDPPPVGGQMCDGKLATIVGDDGRSLLVGTSGDDVIVDLGGDRNVIRGRGGNDLICTSTSVDTIDAGAGNDTIIDTGGNNTITSGPGNDTINTGTGNDTINAGDGDDTINAADGNNTVNGDAGNDTITTGTGNVDSVDGGDGDDTIIDIGGSFPQSRFGIQGGPGDDTITTGPGDDGIDAGAGDDTINAGDGRNTVRGASGDDTITTGTGNDQVNGGDGIDTCTPGPGTNIVRDCETNDNRPPAGQMCDGKLATIVGDDGRSLLVGTSGDDVIVDLGGDRNVIRGRGGNDLICTSTSVDTIDAGAGNDTIIDTGGNNTITSGPGNDTINTGTGNDTINAGDGDDTINAADGNNTVNGDAGNDTITTGTGNVDSVDGGDGDDTIIDIGGSFPQSRFGIQGGPGDDTITTGPGDDGIDAGAGDDTINAGDGRNTVRGASGDDTITTGTGNDQVNGGDGIDSCTPGPGTNTVRDCETNDNRPPAGQMCDGKLATIVGDDGRSLLVGTSGDDVIVDLGGDRNVIRGRGGNDLICTSTSVDTIDAGAGNDTIIDTGGNNTITSGPGNDTIKTGTGDDTINGGDGDDTINAANGNNTVNGDAGNDTITTGTGNVDSVDGGDGDDTIIDIGGSFPQSRFGIQGGPGDDTITTGPGDDGIDAGAGDDTINAGDGRNTVRGASGDDTITTGTGNDQVNGGDGIDSCTPGPGTNTVRDCETNDNRPPAANVS